ncbi:hypothetical protein ABVT39_007680 [Epinephelus coioides]
MREEITETKKQLSENMTDKEEPDKLLQECERRKQELDKEIKLTKKKKIERDRVDYEGGAVYKCRLQNDVEPSGNRNRHQTHRRYHNNDTLRSSFSFRDPPQPVEDTDSMDFASSSEPHAEPNRSHFKVISLPSNTKDSMDLLQTVQSIQMSNEQQYLVTMDIESLYTNVPFEGGLRAAEFFLEKRDTQSPKTKMYSEPDRICTHI